MRIDNMQIIFTIAIIVWMSASLTIMWFWLRDIRNSLLEQFAMLHTRLISKEIENRKERGLYAGEQRC